MITNTNTERKSMKRFSIREVETVKTTAALYGRACNPTPFPPFDPFDPFAPLVYA